MADVGDGVRLCVDERGDPRDPTLLLIGGATWSMDWWDDALCERIAARGRRVVRYDQRDTGQSTHYPAGSPGYAAAELADDAIAVLDAVGVGRAHVVGFSMGGGLAQRLALEHPDRIASLTLISTSPISAVDDLPGPSAEIRAALADPPPEPDWNDRDAVVEHVVDGERPCSGSLDADRVRGTARRAFDRTHDMSASPANHPLVAASAAGEFDLGGLAGVPTLVVHGSVDPMFPVQHGRALAAAIPGARLLELDGVGHELPPPRTWDALVDALIENTRVVAAAVRAER